VKGLPVDVTFEEVFETFTKAGIISKDTISREYKIKLLEDENGKKNGMALVKYFRPESLSLANKIIQGFPLRFDGKEPITFELATAEERKILQNALRKKKGVKLYNQTTELSWDDQELLHVVIKNMFDPVHAKDDPNFYSSLKDDVESECNKFGQVISVKIFERNPDGVAVIKFANSLSAARCIEVMNGRYFDKRKLIAEYYDGYTNYFVQESEEDRKIREEQWAKWLAGNDDYDENQKPDNETETNKPEDMVEETNKPEDMVEETKTQTNNDENDQNNKEDDNPL